MWNKSRSRKKTPTKPCLSWCLLTQCFCWLWDVPSLWFSATTTLPNSAGHRLNTHYYNACLLAEFDWVLHFPGLVVYPNVFKCISKYKHSSVPTYVQNATLNVAQNTFLKGTHRLHNILKECLFNMLCFLYAFNYTYFSHILMSPCEGRTIHIDKNGHSCFLQSQL